MCIVMAKCSVCQKLTAHKTEGVEKTPGGENIQRMKCTVCDTWNNVRTGTGGEDFQKNYEEADNTHLHDGNQDNL